MADAGLVTTPVSHQNPFRLAVPNRPRKPSSIVVVTVELEPPIAFLGDPANPFPAPGLDLGMAGRHRSVPVNHTPEYFRCEVELLALRHRWSRTWPRLLPGIRHEGHSKPIAVADQST
jgi:hypothetical protein